MSDLLSKQIKKKMETLSASEKQEYKESLTDRYINEDGISKSRLLHEKYFENNKRAFETNLLDNISFTNISGITPTFVARSKALIENRDEYALFDQVEKKVHSLLDIDDFMTSPVSEKFVVAEGLNQKDLKTRQKALVNEVTDNGIQSLTNLNDIIAWMEAHIAIKGDDNKQFLPILNALKNVSIVSTRGKDYSEHDFANEIDNLMIYVSKYMDHHKKIPFSKKGKERIAVCQLIAAMTGRMYIEGQKEVREKALEKQKDISIDHYTTYYPGKQLDDVNLNSENLIKLEDMNNFAIGNILANNNNTAICEVCNEFVKLHFLISNPDDAISGINAIIRKSASFITLAESYVSDETNEKREEIAVLLNEIHRISDCLKISKQNHNFLYHSILTKSSITPDYLKYEVSAKNYPGLPKEYLDEIDEKRTKELENYAKTVDQKSMLQAALQDSDILKISNIVLGKPKFRTLDNGKKVLDYDQNKLENNTNYLNTYLSTSLIKLHMSRNNPDEYNKNLNVLKDLMSKSLLESMMFPLFTEEMEDVDWYMKNYEQIQLMANYAEIVFIIKHSENLKAIYNSLDEYTKENLDLYSKFWRQYNNHMILKTTKTNGSENPNLNMKDEDERPEEEEIIENKEEKKIKEDNDEDEEEEEEYYDQEEVALNLFEKSKKELINTEKNNPKKCEQRAYVTFKKAFENFSEKLPDANDSFSDNNQKYLVELKGIINSFSAGKDVYIEEIAGSLALIEKMPETVRNIGIVKEFKNSCNKYGKSLIGDEKEKFTIAYSNSKKPAVLFNIVTTDIENETREVATVDELSLLDKMFYVLPLDGIEEQNEEYKNKVLNLVNSINECNAIVLDLLKDEDVKKFYAENTNEMFDFIEQSGITTATAYQPEVDAFAQINKWLAEPSKYGFKNKKEAKEGELNTSMLDEILKAQKRKYFHKFIQASIDRVLYRFINYVEKGDYQGSPEKVQKFRQAIEKLNANKDILDKVGTVGVTVITRAIITIKHHKDYIPEEGEKKSRTVEEYNGVLDVFKKCMKGNPSYPSTKASEFPL